MDLDLERKRLIQRTENILSRKYTSGQNFLKHGLKKISDGVKYGDRLYDLMDWAGIEEIVYSEAGIQSVFWDRI